MSLLPGEKQATSRGNPMMNDGAIRNFEQIQEDHEARRTPRAVTAAFVLLGGACVVFAALALGGRHMKADAPRADPLGDLVAQRGHPAGPSSARATDLSAKDVTFPNILSDGQNPTTALAAVRGANLPSSAAVATPPPPTDRLPVVPLPAQNLLEATPVVTRPRDSLTRAASDQAQMGAGPAADAAPAGKEGGYQLQVSSFRTIGEANHFADQLRARGHHAYAVEAHVPGRGTWYRVRVGPFASQVQAANYRSSFESREHVVPFIVPPPEKK